MDGNRLQQPTKNGMLFSTDLSIEVSRYAGFQGSNIMVNVGIRCDGIKRNFKICSANECILTLCFEFYIRLLSFQFEFCRVSFAFCISYFFHI